MNILITGTSNGIGKAAAQKFLSEGHTVYGFDIKKASIEAETYRHFKLDIRDEAAYPELPEIQILINNAGVQNFCKDPSTGIKENTSGKLLCHTEDIEINLKGTIAVTEHYGITPSIKSIVMIGSASGHTGSEFPEYSASKGGVLSYTKNVALRIAQYGATCNSLDFGGVMTELNEPVMKDEKLWTQIMDLTPLKRWMSPEEAADWIYFMAVTNRFCTGQNILIDGLEAGNANFIWP